MLKQFSKSSIMIWKVQNELKKLIDIDDITQELLHKLIYKIEVKEKQGSDYPLSIFKPFFCQLK